MKRSFIRGIWGDFSHNDQKHLKRRNGASLREKVHSDMELTLANPYEPDVVVYVFGKENEKKSIDMGFKDVRLLDRRPSIWDMKTEIYRHKIEIWNQAMVDFDEILFTDWDCIPATKIPDDFWDVMGKGQSLQGALFSYHRRKNRWRTAAQRTVIAATFLYMRDKQIPKDVIALWERTGKPWSEESLLMHYWDEANGGWKGAEYYLENGFEPLYHTLYGYGKDVFETREMLYYHVNMNKVRHFLQGKSPEGIKKRIDDFYEERSKKLVISNG